MTTVVATHAVGNMETWLGGGATRSEVFSTFCSRYRIFKHGEQDRVSIVWEDVDIDKMRSVLSSAQAAESKAEHTVIDPVELYFEVEGGT